MVIQLPVLAGDTPKKSIKDDEFGCESTVSAIAKALIEQVNSDGYILGIEGVWGSGKSSYANFIAEEIRSRCPAHEIIRFEPWLVGERGAFLPACLGQLALCIENVEGVTAPWWRIDRHVMRRKKRLANKMRKYGTYASVLAAPAGSIAASDPTGTMALTAVGLRGFGAISKLLGNGPTFEKLKAEISRDIRRLQTTRPGLRFVVIIDDTDRLEPAEAIEVLRLIRKVVDFPLITYLLCFDQNVLAGQVCAAAQVEDGYAFVEKIFQNVVAIPPQEPFALRRYLRKLLQEAFGKDLVSLHAGERDAPYREHIVLNLWVGTRRSSVVRGGQVGLAPCAGRLRFLGFFVASTNQAKARKTLQLDCALPNECCFVSRRRSTGRSRCRIAGRKPVQHNVGSALGEEIL